MYVPAVYVSIPYERESTCEHDSESAAETAGELVSIPYERESTCELKGSTLDPKIKERVQFQFPTNGKAHVNNKEIMGQLKSFQSFNSLRTGKDM